MFGGNSNWRGPIWMPVNAMIIRALLQYYAFYGDEFTVECPTGSGRQMTLYQVAEEIAARLGSIFLRDKDGRRPVYGATRKFQEDPHWRDISYSSNFHGDNNGPGPAIRLVDRSIGNALFATTTTQNEATRWRSMELVTQDHRIAAPADARPQRAAISVALSDHTRLMTDCQAWPLRPWTIFDAALDRLAKLGSIDLA
jgi:hypothetical protein